MLLAALEGEGSPSASSKAGAEIGTRGGGAGP